MDLIVDAGWEQLQCGITDASDSPEFIDLVIKCGKEIFLKHKLMVHLRSKRLAAKITNTDDEQRQHCGQLNLDDEELVLVKRLLHYIYNSNYDGIWHEGQESWNADLVGEIEVTQENAEKNKLEEVEVVDCMTTPSTRRSTSSSDGVMTGWGPRVQPESPAYACDELQAPPCSADLADEKQFEARLDDERAIEEAFPEVEPSLKCSAGDDSTDLLGKEPPTFDDADPSVTIEPAGECIAEDEPERNPWKVWAPYLSKKTQKSIEPIGRMPDYDLPVMEKVDETKDIIDNFRGHSEDLSTWDLIATSKEKKKEKKKGISNCIEIYPDAEPAVVESDPLNAPYESMEATPLPSDDCTPTLALASKKDKRARARAALDELAVPVPIDEPVEPVYMESMAVEPAPEEGEPVQLDYMDEPAEPGSILALGYMTKKKKKMKGKKKGTKILNSVAAAVEVELVPTAGVLHPPILSPSLSIPEACDAQVAEPYEEPCEVTCEKPCEEPCEGPCEVTCEATCEEPCEVTCEATCEEPCEVTCEKPCEEPYEVTCEATCEEPCEETCEEPFAVVEEPPTAAIPPTPHPSLLLNARMYLLACRYDMPVLEKLALAKFKDRLKVAWNSADFALCVADIYAGHVEGDAMALRNLVVETAWHELRSLKMRKDFMDLLRKELRFGYDLLERIDVDGNMVSMMSALDN